jgi:hypothetical protein
LAAQASIGLPQHECKWRKTAEHLEKPYQGLMETFFGLIAEDKVKVRIMFTQNSMPAVGLTKEQHDSTFFILYYHFLKHAFGLNHSDPIPGGVHLRIYPDELPASKADVEDFKSFLVALASSYDFRKLDIRIRRDDIAEVCSHDHVIMQCLDLVLGSMQYRLNNGHKVIPDGAKRRGKRTRAKERLYKHIYKLICTIYPRFNIGISTGIGSHWSNRWNHPYRHWRFIPKDHGFDPTMIKPK